MNTIKRKTNIFLDSIEPVSFPSILDSIIYLLIPLFLILNMFKITKLFSLHINMLYIKIFIAFFGFTYGFKHLNPYLSTVVNIKTTIKTSVKLIILYTVILLLLIPLTGKDPQQLQNLNLSNKEYYLSLIELPFTAISEEVFKSLMLLALIRLLPMKKYKVIVAILISSLIFGLLHINYAYQNSINILLPIGLSAIPTFIFFLYYKSIYPSMIVHFVTDFIVITKFTANFSFIFTFFFYTLCAATVVIFISSIIFILLKEHKNRVVNKSK